MPLALSDGAMLMCTFGNAPSVFSAPPIPMPFSAMSLQVATVTAALPGANIKPFGTCIKLTADALGVPVPCVPATVAWTPPAALASVCGLKVATVQSLCQCSIGGTIRVVTPGQMLLDVI